MPGGFIMARAKKTALGGAHSDYYDCYFVRLSFYAVQHPFREGQYLTEQLCRVRGLLE